MLPNVHVIVRLTFKIPLRTYDLKSDESVQIDKLRFKNK